MTPELAQGGPTGMPSFDHVLLTRFNVRGFLRSAPVEDSWMEHRCRLFERFCLPSVQSQTAPCSAWLVLFDQATPGRWRSRIEEWTRRAPGLVAHFVGSFAQINLPALVDEVTDSRKELLVTTRLDNDDALARDFLGRVQSALRNLAASRELRERCFINLDRGYVLCERRLYRSHQPSNPFLSLVERRQQAAGSSTGIRTVWCTEHKQAHEVAPIHHVQGSPAWLQVLHERNATNRLYVTRREPLGALRQRFGLALPADELREGRPAPWLANGAWILRRVYRRLQRAGLLPSG